jgi:hypothetical protein
MFCPRVLTALRAHRSAIVASASCARPAVFPVASLFPWPMACSRTVDVGGRPSQLRTKVAEPVVQSGRPISVKAAQSLGSGELSLVDRMADLRDATLLWPAIISL